MNMNVKMGLRGEYDSEVVVFNDISFDVQIDDEKLEEINFDAAVKMSDKDEYSEEGFLAVEKLLDILGENQKFCKEIYEKLYNGASHLADKYGYPGEQLCVVASLTINNKVIKAFETDESIEWVNYDDPYKFVFSGFNQPYEEDGQAYRAY
jgi:hypothetical protein